MKSSRYAFTMIELIFVIVILGILSAIAIPKLAATRSDAEVSKTAQNIMVALSEISSYAMSKSETEDNLSEMSYSIESLVEAGDADINTSDKSATIHFGGVADCVKIKIETDDDEDNLTIKLGDASGKGKCLQLQSTIDRTKYSMQLRGRSVIY